MQPTLRPGDRLLIRFGGRPRPGSIVIVRLPRRPIAVKRVRSRAAAGGWDVRSDNPAVGTDSRVLGAIPDDDVVATVVCRLWPPIRQPRPQ